MLISLSYIFLVGMFLSWICKKVELPGLLGMIFTGILLGPYCLGLIDSSLLNISSELRKIALIIILSFFKIGLYPLVIATVVNIIYVTVFNYIKVKKIFRNK